MACLLGFFAYRRRGSAPADENTAESAIWHMVDAARAADPGRCLDCYTGERGAGFFRQS